MAYEVQKRVGARTYRYRVESYRDPASGKVRGRWTYLGRADGPESPPTRRAPSRTRERLLDALGRLLERHDYADLTAGRVAEEAGLAHGTFYRHFRDKPAALRAAFDALKETLARQRPTFDGPLGSRDDERTRFRAWVASHFRATERPGLLRAWYTAQATDAALRGDRLARRGERQALLARYLERLETAGLVAPLDAGASALALLALFDGLFRLSVYDGIAFDEAAIAGAVDVFERAVFGAPPPREVAGAGGTHSTG